MGFDLTSEINAIYYSLPDDEHAEWPATLLGEASKHLERVLDDVK